jgi:serine/threonine protein kinase/Tol biopolymer transport system component
MATQLLDGRYQIIEVIESGEYGQTYIAKDTRRPGEPLCFVKHLRPGNHDPKLINTARRLFQKEAEILEKLGQHEQIPQLYAYFENNQEFFLVEAFIPGHSLADELTPGKPLPEPEVINLLKEILEILEFVHNNNVIHRDIKPANLVRRESDEKLMLIDFGAVKEISIEHRQNTPTVRIGTLEYMPMEQFNYNPQFNSDIYAVGIIGIQALTGSPTYELSKLRNHNNGNSGEIMWHHLAVCSPEFQEILDKMVHFDYHQRYETTQEVLKDLNVLHERLFRKPPKLQEYRRELERLASNRGDISVVGRSILEELRINLDLSPEEIEQIEDEVLNPYRKFNEKCQRYEQALIKSVQEEYPFSQETREELQELQKILNLDDAQIELIESRVLPKSLLIKVQNFIINLLPFHNPPQKVFRFYPEGVKIELAKSAQNKVVTPVVTPVITPVITPAITPVITPATAPIQPRKKIRPHLYIWGSAVTALVAIAGAIYGYLKWQEQQDLWAKEAPKIDEIKGLLASKDFQNCHQSFEKINQTSPFYDEAKNLNKKCEEALNWQNVQFSNLGQLSDPIGAISFQSNGLLLASGSKDGTIKTWDLKNGNQIRTFDGDASPIWTVTFNAKGTRIAGGTYYWRIFVWNVETGELVRTLEHNATVWSVALSPDGKTLASGSGDKTVKVWDLGTGELIYNFTDHLDSIFSIAISPDGKKLVSASKDKTLKVWDLAKGELIRTLQGHSADVRSVVISPDGKLIISGSYDSTVKIWSLENGDLIDTLRGHQGEVISVAISPDNQFIASASKDKTVKIWKLKSGELLNTLTGHTDEVYTVAFSPDGKTLASSGKDKTIKIWSR